MRAYLDQRPDRTAEILSQLGYPLPYFMMILGLQATPNRFTLELIAITQVLASHVAMVAKHHLACRRADRIGAKVMPMIPTPAHGSFPSAHSTESFATAEVLRTFVKYHKHHYADFDRRQMLLSKLAERIAVNRTVAGVHYPIDTWAGAVLGRAVGQIVLAKCGAAACVDGYCYRAKGERDFFVTEFLPGENHGYGVEKKDSFEVEPSPLFTWLWQKAGQEFDLHDRGS
jgi:membrane-associated phospholipid phosphatase